MAETQIELEERRQQKHRENERGEVVAVRHEIEYFSNDIRMAKQLNHPKGQVPDFKCPQGRSRSLMRELKPLMARGKW